jgi:hypothetical protein
VNQANKPTVKLSDEEYHARWMTQYVEQGGRCWACGRRDGGLQFHHVYSRGIGGGFRDDTQGVLICGRRQCHRKADQERPSKFTEEESDGKERQE